jgi:hypothetical protein
VGVTNLFLSRFFCNAEQRLSSEKCCISGYSVLDLTFQDSSVK